VTRIEILNIFTGQENTLWFDGDWFSNLPQKWLLDKHRIIYFNKNMGLQMNGIL
jgi:hypothetical protein